MPAPGGNRHGSAGFVTGPWSGPGRRWAAALTAAVAAAVLVPPEPAQAQAEPPAIPHGKGQLKGQVKQPAQPPPAAATNPQIPDANALAMLIQSHLVALSQANLTGNFTVLHAMGSPSFQQANPPAKLAEIFNKNLRDRGIDLTPVILFSPTLVREPTIDDKGLLHLTGYYKTEPQQVHFDLSFQVVAGYWRLFSITVGTVPANLPPPAAGQPAAKK